jgi:hypothetical protein
VIDKLNKVTLHPSIKSQVQYMCTFHHKRICWHFLVHVTTYNTIISRTVHASSTICNLYTNIGEMKDCPRFLRSPRFTADVSRNAHSRVPVGSFAKRPFCSLELQRSPATPTKQPQPVGPNPNPLAPLLPSPSSTPRPTAASPATPPASTVAAP